MKANAGAPHELNLVNSSRLRAIREKQLLDKPQSSKSFEPKPDLSELHMAQQLIDAALHEIISQLPEGKQRSFFKIRFGVDLAEIKQGSVLDAFKLLGISQQSLTNPQAVAELNYNGDRIKSA